MKSFTVESGLYVLRYLSSIDVRTAPSAVVRAAPGHDGDIDLVSAPGHRDGELAAPGSSIVILARRAAAVVVSLEPVPGSSNLDATLSLGLLAAAVRTAATAAASLRDAPDAAAAGSWDRGAKAMRVAMLAHVKWRGDITPDPEGWIGGPLAPSAIEGLSFRCEGADVGIAAQCMNTLDRQRWSPWQPPGSFVGTRQKASPLTALRLKLAGADAAGFEIQAEAQFLGAPTVAAQGREIDLVTPAGADPLVGLRLQLVDVAARRGSIADARLPRVRVFR